MKKYNWIAGVIWFAGIIGLIGQGCYFAHILRNTIEKMTSHIGFLITESANELSMVSADVENGVSYDVDKRELYYVIDGREIIRELDEDVSSYWVTTAPFYDVRDTSVWTLETLDMMAQEEFERQQMRVLALRLTVRDSAGRVLQTFGEEKEVKGVACHYEREMGYLTRNTLEADYVIPYAAIWEEMREEAILLGIIAVMTVCCLVLLYKYFRIEKTNAQLRAFYMSMYRHDLRTPISAISTRVYSLKMAGGERLTERERKGLEAIDLAVKQVRRGIEQLAAMEVCEGKVRVDFQPVDVNKLAKEVVRWERWHAGEEEAERIRTNLRAEQAEVKGNMPALASVLQNLIGNALKYAGDEAMVTVRSGNPQEGRIRIEVEDNGRGIGEEERERIFRRGYRGANYDGKPAGKGMGLYMARRIVRRHRGEMGVESEPGKGCRFWIVLPLA